MDTSRTTEKRLTTGQEEPWKKLSWLEKPDMTWAGSSTIFLAGGNLCPCWSEEARLGKGISMCTSLHGGWHCKH